MSPVTDPYQPIERTLRLTRRCLEVFARYSDLDLLLIQTRGAAVLDDLDLIARIPYAWLGMTIETDRGDLPYGPSKSQVERLLAAVTQAVARGVKAQIAVSPCLPHSLDFAERLLATGAQRIVIDTFAIGDGSRGRRTETVPSRPWPTTTGATTASPRLYEQLSAYHDAVAWSGPGFAGIPGRAACD